MIRSAIPVSLALLLSFMTGCSTYEVSVNEQVVYSPPPLFSQYKITDRTLKTCVKASIIEQKVHHVDQLKSLKCPLGNIESLSGIETFVALEQLGIANNAVHDITPLLTLKELKQLDLEGNALVEVEALHVLKKLAFINLKGNKRLNCDDLEGFPSYTKVTSPEHCSGPGNKH